MLHTFFDKARASIREKEQGHATTFYDWNRRRVSDGGSPDRSTESEHRDHSGKGACNFRRANQARDAEVNGRAYFRYFAGYPYCTERNAHVEGYISPISG